MARVAFAFGSALLLVLVLGTEAQSCKNTTTPLWGQVCSKGGTVCTTTKSISDGRITRVTGFYHFSYGCLQGLTVAYGDSRSPLQQRAYTLGTDRKLTPVRGKLACKRVSNLSMGLMPLELITNVDLVISKRADPLPDCIEYIKFTSNFGTEMSLGKASAAGTKHSSAAPKGGYLQGIQATEFDFARYNGTDTCVNQPLREQLYLGTADKNCKGRTSGCPVLQQLSFTWSTCT